MIIKNRMGREVADSLPQTGKTAGELIEQASGLHAETDNPNRDGAQTTIPALCKPQSSRNKTGTDQFTDF